MGDYSFGPSAKGWTVILSLCVIGLAAVIVWLSQLAIYLWHHLLWVK
jgi:hypothetical protein